MFVGLVTKHRREAAASTDEDLDALDAILAITGSLDDFQRLVVIYITETPSGVLSGQDMLRRLHLFVAR